MEKTSGSNINLLPGDDLDMVPLGKFLKWALAYGRYIIVITELVVLAAFLSRFKLDRDLSDLSDNILRKVKIVEASAPFEKNVRHLQDRLQIISKIVDKTGRPSQYLEFLGASLPQGVTLTSLKMVDTFVTLFGTTTSEAGVATLVTAFSKDSRVRSVSINNLDKDAKTNLLNFSVSISLWP